MTLIFVDSAGEEKSLGTVEDLESAVNLMVSDMQKRFVFPTGLIRFPFEKGAEMLCGKGEDGCKYTLI